MTNHSLKFCARNIRHAAALAAAAALMLFSGLARAEGVKTKEGCFITKGTDQGLPPPSWSGQCANGLISGIGRLTSSAYSGGKVVESESWFEAFDGWWSMDRNPYYFQVNPVMPELTSFWRSKPGGYNDRISEQQCRTLAGCDRIQAKRVEMMGSAGASKQARDADAALAASEQEMREQDAAIQRNKVNLANTLAQAAAASAGSRRNTTPAPAQPQNIASAASAPGQSGVSAGAGNTNQPLEARVDRNDMPNDHAPFINGTCVKILQNGRGVSSAYKKIVNNCAVPVVVLFCLEKSSAINECRNRVRYGSSDKIASGKSQITADAIEGAWNAYYFVCDVHDPKRSSCITPKVIN